MLREARNRLGLSQQQVATLIGIQIRQYQRFEYGETEIQRISIRAGLALCVVLDLDPVDLVFGSDTTALFALKEQRYVKRQSDMKPGKRPRKRPSNGYTAP